MTELGLSKAEVEGVKKTWALVEANLDDHGVGIIKLLFETHPEYKSLFKTIKSEKDPAFYKHAKTFIKSLQSMVQNLENTSKLVELLHDNAEKHHARKITITHYEKTLALVPVYLQGKLDSALDPVAASGWGKVLKTMQEVIGAKLKELENADK